MSDRSPRQGMFFTGGRLGRRQVFPLAGAAAAAAAFGPAALASAQGQGSAPAELRTSQSGSLAGNSGGAYASYQISSPTGSTVNLTLTYSPLMGSLGNGVAIEAYQTGGKLGSATDSLGSGTVTLSITPVTGSPAIVKVGNYLAGITINYTLTSSSGAAAAAGAAPSTAPSAAQARYVYVGTYTAPNTAPGGKVPSTAQGIYVFKMDPSTGGLTPVQTVPNIPNPSWVTLDPQMRYLFCANEVTTWKGQANTGGVSALSIDPATGMLTPINDQPSMGTIAAHVAVDPTSSYLLVANYSGGTFAILPIQAGGKLGPATDVFTPTGKGPNTGRQEAPHPHMVIFDPAGAYVFGNDLGTDKVWSWKLDTTAGKFAPNTIPYVQVASGSGPRHTAFHPSGKFAYVISEMASSITAFAYDAAHGTMIWIQTVSTLPAGFTGSSSTAEIIMHPSGKWVYGSNRGHDSIAAFAIDQNTGMLTSAGWTPTQGNIPRGFNIDPSGSILLAGNQNSDSIVPFRIDPGTGALTPTGAVTHTPVPVSIQFGRVIGS